MFKISSIQELNKMIADVKRSMFPPNRLLRTVTQDDPVQVQPSLHGLTNHREREEPEMAPERARDENIHTRGEEVHEICRRDLREFAERAAEEQFVRGIEREIEEVHRNEEDSIDLESKFYTYIDEYGASYTCNIITDGICIYPILAEVVGSINVDGEFNPNIIMCRRQTAKKLVYWRTYNFVNKFDAEILNRANLHLINKQNVKSYVKESLEKFQREVDDLIIHTDNLSRQRDHLLRVIGQNSLPRIVVCSKITRASAHNTIHCWPVYVFINFHDAKRIVYSQKDIENMGKNKFFDSIGSTNPKLKKFKRSSRGYGGRIRNRPPDREVNVSRDARDIDRDVSHMVRDTVTHRGRPITAAVTNIEAPHPSVDERHHEGYANDRLNVSIEENNIPPWVAFGAPIQEGQNDQNEEEGQQNDGGENRDPTIRTILGVRDNAIGESAPHAISIDEDEDQDEREGLDEQV